MQAINLLMMRAFARAFAFDGAAVLEVGSFTVPGHEHNMRIRELFKGANYTGIDMRPGNGVDRIEDVEKMTFEDGSFDLVICLDTLEHVKRPFHAVAEIHRVLKPGGIAVIASVMNFPIHEYPADYWRFTPECFRLLTEDFGAQYVGYFGYSLFPQNIYAICSRAPARSDFDSRMTEFKVTWKNDTLYSRFETFGSAGRNLMASLMRFANNWTIRLTKVD